MTLLSLADAFLINPPVRISKGVVTPFVAMEDVEPFRRDVRASEMRPYSGGAKFMPGDIVMARITPSLENGKTSRYVSDDGMPAAGSTEFIVIRGRDRVTDTSFAYYVFTSTEIREFAISQMNGSSGRQRVQTDSLANYQIALPSLPEQRAIAATLGALDDKIESNRRAIKIIEDLLQAHFKAVLEQNKFTMLNFDDVVSRLPVLHKHNHGSVGSRGRIVVLDQSELGILGYHDGDAEFITTADNPLCLFGDHTCSWRLGIGSFDVGPNVIPVTTSSVSGVHSTWLYFSLLGAQDFQEYRRHWMELKRHAIPWVSSRVQDLFVKRATVLLEYWSYLQAQSSRLSDLRDALLPELLSGRISVPEAQEIVA